MIESPGRFFWFMTCSLVMGWLASTGSQQCYLSFEDRIEAQRSIEEVYYSHQTGADREFSQAVPAEAIAQKVRTYLAQSIVLERIWNTPLTPAMLEEELKRIRRYTRFPDRLHEIFDALGNDPLLIRETFVRATLADRLARAFLAADQRFQLPARRESEELHQQLLSGRLRPDADHPRRRVLRVKRAATNVLESVRHRRQPGHELATRRPEESVLPAWWDTAPGIVGEAGPLVERPDSFAVQVVLGADADEVRLATYEIPKVTWETWWRENERSFDVAELELNSLEPPGTAVGPAMEIELQQGSEEGWRPTPNTGSLKERVYHSVVWTGTHMIVWGGVYMGPPVQFSYVLNSGSRYDPLTDTWSPTTTANAPSPRAWHTAVWTGSEMIVWGGFDGSPVGTMLGGRYDPLTNIWSPMSTENAPYVPDFGEPNVLSFHTAIWTGTEMIVWGGQDYYSGIHNIGGRYDPVADRWSPVSTLDDPGPRMDHSAIWTGGQMIVWGGWKAKTLATGGSYDPGNDSWTALPTVDAPEARRRHTAVWTGSEMIVWGGARAFEIESFTDTGAAFNPLSWSWRPLSAVNGPSPRAGHSSVWTGERMIIWGGHVGPTDGGGWPATGARYDPVSDCWAPTTTTNAPTGRAGHSAVWTGSEMIVWGGTSGLVRYDFNTGALYTPGTSDSCRNQLPQAVAGANQSVECASHEGASVTVDGAGSTDPDGDSLTFLWSAPGIEFDDPASPTPTATFPLGTTLVTLIVSDGESEAMDTVSVMVVDSTPPSLLVSASPTILWPPNHRMVPVTLSAAAQDACDPTPEVSFVLVTSSEPDDAAGEGDGHTTGDIQNVIPGPMGTPVLLRAERDGAGGGRIYTITYRGTDHSGNTSTAVSGVLVPHDQ